MTCRDIEIHILDYQDKRLSPEKTAAVDGHLALCADCRMFARQLAQLDSTLSSTINAPRLSTDFDRRLHEKIQRAPTLSVQDRAARQRQLQEEFEADMERIGYGRFAFEELVMPLAGAFVAALAAWIVWLFVPAMTAHLGRAWLGFLDPRTIPFLVAGAIILSASLAESPPRKRLA